MSLFRNLKKLFGQDKEPGVTRAGGKQPSDPEQTKKKPAGGTEVNRTPPPGNLPRARGDEAEPGLSARSYRKGDLLDNRYKVETVLSGAMGYVYIGKDTRQRITFAIKQPKAEMLVDRDRFARVVHEADAWTGLGMHPHIAYCYFVKSIDEIPHIFIEYVDGGNLEDWIGDRRCADYKVGLDMAIQICHGLERAHERGMIHRDIKPKNILVSQDGQVKITDFGIAGGSNTREQAGKSVTPKASDDFKGTRPGDTLGTLYYMPPEQHRDPRQKSEEAPNGVWYDSDIFSVGVCMWEMFCGKRPYVISTDATGSLPDPGELRRELPEGLKSVLCKSVELDRRNRYQNSKELCDALNGVYRELFDEDAPSYRLELHDTTADELNNQGYSYYELGKKAEARRCFERAVEINNTHPEAVFNLALMQWRCGEIDDLEVLRRLEDCSNNPGVIKEKAAELMAYVHAERGDTKAAREVLKAYPGKYEDLLGESDIGMTGLIRTFDHNEIVDSVSLTADARYALSWGWDHTMKLWDVKTGECLRTFGEHKNRVYVYSVILSADGKLALSGNDDMTLKLWDVKTGECLHTFEGHTESVHSVSLSPDSRYALSASYDKTLKLWDVETGECLRTFEGHKDSIYSVSLSADGKYALSGSRDETLKLWDVETGECLRTFEGHGISSVSLSADGRYALSGSRDKTLKLWDVKTGECLRTFEGHTGKVAIVGLSLDGVYALSVSVDKTLKLWNVETGQCLRTVEGYVSSDEAGVSLSAGGKYALIGVGCVLDLWALDFNTSYNAALVVSDFKGFTETKNIQDAINIAVETAERLIREKHYTKACRALYDVWEQTGFQENRLVERVYQQLYKISSRRVFVFGYEKHKFEGHTEYVNSVSQSPDGLYALSGAGSLMSKDDKLKLWDVETGECLRTFEGHTRWVASVSLSADGRYALSGSGDKTLKLWDVESGECLRTFEGHAGGVTSVSLGADGNYALSGSGDKTLKLWDVETGEFLRTFEGHARGVTSVSLGADGNYALSGSLDNTLKLWDVVTGKYLLTFEGHKDYVRSVSLSADGKYAFSGSKDRTLKLWDVKTGKCLRTFEGHAGGATSVSLSADGKYALSGSEDKALRLWNLDKGECLRTFEGHAGGVTSVSLSADGRYALSGSYDKTLKLWRLVWKLEFDDE